MTYSLGSSTGPLTGNGTIVVNKPIGLLVKVTTYPASAGRRNGVPIDYFGLGHLTPADANGYYPNLVINHLQNVFYPLPDSITSIGYTLTPGVAVTVQQLVGQIAVPPYYDRQAGVHRLEVGTESGGHVLTQRWSYTVPAQFHAMLELAYLHVMRYSATSQPGEALMQIHVGGTTLLDVRIMGGAEGVTKQASMDGPMWLPGGTTLTCRTRDLSTGGSVVFIGVAHLTLYTP